MNWPQLDELKQLLDITSDEWDGEDEYGDDTRLSQILAAAIERVKADVGHWDEAYDEPDARLARAALRMAELLSTRPESADADTTYRRLLAGHRRVFGVA